MNTKTLTEEQIKYVQSPVLIKTPENRRAIQDIRDFQNLENKGYTFSYNYNKKQYEAYPITSV